MRTASPSNYSFDPDLQFVCPELSWFHTYWNAKRGGRSFPARADIAPRDLVKFLPWVHMYDVLDGGKDFRIRLYGTEIDNLFGINEFRGKPISTLPPPAYERLHEHLMQVLKTRAPVRAYTASSVLPKQDYKSAEDIYAPLSSNGVDIDVIIAVTHLEKSK